MHDPMTVAFDIKRPWPQWVPAAHTSQRKLYGRFYWPTWLTIWHVDPERDGTDDSCGWSRPKLTPAQLIDLRFFAGCEAREPWLMRDRAKQPLDAAEAVSKLTEAFMLVGQRLHAGVTRAEAADWAARLVHNPMDNVRGALCHLPGWHTNNREDREEDRRERALVLYAILARYVLRERRPWYRHPRWHVWHWRVQVHPLQAFKRWAFSRCAKCGGRFPWGYAPVSGSWNGAGPQWFRSEQGVYHSGCTGDMYVAKH